MEVWQIELLKISGTALIAFFGGLGSYWLYLRKRKIENAPDREKLQEAEKLTTLLIQHRKHNISPNGIVGVQGKNAVSHLPRRSRMA